MKQPCHSSCDASLVINSLKQHKHTPEITTATSDSLEYLWVDEDEQILDELEERAEEKHSPEGGAQAQHQARLSLTLRLVIS